MAESSGKNSLWILFLFLVCDACCYLFLFHLQFGPYIEAEYWLRDVGIVKQEICRRAKSPKTVILSGSNALFGFDAHRLEHLLGRPVVNFGLHAGLSLDYLLTRYDFNLEPGDTVIMPLEYEFYEADRINTEWFTTQIIAWDKPYFERLSIDEKFRFITSVSPLRLVANLAKKYMLGQPRDLLPREEILDSAAAVWRNADFRNDYHFKNINERGDMARRQNIHIHSAPDYPVFEKNFEISGYAKEQLARFFTKCHRQGVSVVVTWPCIMDRDHADVWTTDAFKRNIRKIKSFISSQGVPVVGNPMDFSFPQALFYDTKYHLNQQGRQMRTLVLSERMLQDERFAAQYGFSAKLEEIERAVSVLRRKNEDLQKIADLYWQEGKPSAAILMLEQGLQQGYVNTRTVPILLDYLAAHRTPFLHSRFTDILASPAADIRTFDIGGNAYLMGTTPDGWTTDKTPGFLLLKPSRLARKIRLVCNAPAQAYPMTVTLESASEKFFRRFDAPGEIAFEPPERFHDDEHLFVISTDKHWTPGGPDNRRLGVRISVASRPR